MGILHAAAGGGSKEALENREIFRTETFHEFAEDLEGLQRSEGMVCGDGDSEKLGGKGWSDIAFQSVPVAGSMEVHEGIQFVVLQIGQDRLFRKAGIGDLTGLDIHTAHGKKRVGEMVLCRGIDGIESCSAITKKVQIAV